MNRSERRKLRATNPTVSARADDPFQKAVDAERAGNKVAALVLYQQCVAQSPDNIEAYFRLGGVLRAQGDLAGALIAYQVAAKAWPRHFETLVNLAETLRQAGRLDEGLAFADRAIAIDKTRMEGFLVGGLIRQQLGDLGGAIETLMAAAAVDQRSALVRKTLGQALSDAGRRAEAKVAFEAAVALDATDSDLHRLLGVIYFYEGETWKSFTSLQKAIEIDPQDAVAYSHLAGMLSHTPQLDLAVSSARVAIRLNPTHALARFNLGAALERQGNTRDAIQAYLEALACQPDLGNALVAACRLKQQICDWSDLDAFKELVPTLSYKAGKSVPPFDILTMSPSPSDLLESARVFAASLKRDAGPSLTTYAPRPAPRRGERIRIGYLSADLHVHATAALIAEVFEQHDKTVFETYAYSIGRSDSSPMRQRLVAAFDHFKDLNEVSHADAAAAIRDDGIDILVDLKGYTYRSRPEILAKRPASIQVNFLGYPGTMGTDFIDYIVGDAVVTPAEHAIFFDEKIVTLPNSYQPNDRKRVVADITPSRAACGLPDQGFVFCCFNGNYKITPAILDCWMRIIAAVPGSVLWLLQSGMDAAANLRREVAARGIDTRRLVFAPQLPLSDHLARMRNGDLFLDTQPVGAHTTASEALWVGLPVLTCLGEAFPARVGASLLHAVDLAEMIMPSLAAYEAEAIRLASSPAQAAALRAKLAANIADAPLFDAPRFTRNLEQAYARMVELRDSGTPPQAFTVTDAPR